MASAPARSSSGSDSTRGAASPARLHTLALLVICVASGALAGCGGGGGDPDTARVVRVVDGDTLVVAVGGTDERVRLIGIDTPETVDPRKPVECFGKEASARLTALLPPDTPVRLERDAELRDRYGRLLAYVTRSDDGLFVNEAMLAEGLAQTLTIPPNVAYTERFTAAQTAARAAGRGFWSACPHE